MKKCKGFFLYHSKFGISYGKYITLALSKSQTVRQFTHYFGFFLSTVLVRASWIENKIQKSAFLTLIFPTFLKSSEMKMSNDSSGGCSIITSRIADEWVSVLFVILRDENKGGEWYLIKGCNVTVKKIVKPLFALLWRNRDFI